MRNHWTVVGYYVETNEVYVEHVAGEDMTAQQAAEEAVRVYPARGAAVTIAAFRGHLDDEWGGLGLATTKEED